MPRVKRPDEMTPEEYANWNRAAADRLREIRAPYPPRPYVDPFLEGRADELAEERKAIREGEFASDAEQDEAADRYHDRLDREW